MDVGLLHNMTPEIIVVAVAGFCIAWVIFVAIATLREANNKTANDAAERAAQVMVVLPMLILVALAFAFMDFVRQARKHILLIGFFAGLLLLVIGIGLMMTEMGCTTYWYAKFCTNVTIVELALLAALLAGFIKFILDNLEDDHGR